MARPSDFVRFTGIAHVSSALRRHRAGACEEEGQGADLRSWAPELIVMVLCLAGAQKAPLADITCLILSRAYLELEDVRFWRRRWCILRATLQEPIVPVAGAAKDEGHKQSNN